MAERDDGAGAVGLVALVLVVVVAIVVPKPLWITIVIVFGIAAVAIVGTLVRKDLGEQRQVRQAADRAAAEEQAQLERARQSSRLGSENVKRFEAAQAAAERVTHSDAAHEGWLGEVDFTEDLRTVEENFEKSTALRVTAADLRALSDPTPDDRRILSDAQDAADRLESAAIRLVDLIGRCADEADLIDASLRKQHQDVENERRRAELHGDLSAMLYGVESAVDGEPSEAGADRVMARVAAYREIIAEIARVRDQ